MNVATISFVGTRRDIGEAQGRRISALRLPPVTSQDDFPHRSRAAVEKWHPAILEEFAGMLDASGLPEQEFESYYFGRTAPLAGGCTNVCVLPEATADKRTLVGRNYDWAYADKQWCEARAILPEGERRRVGYTHHWGGLCDGMNDAGLMVCIAALPSAGENRPGIQWHIVVDMLLSLCSTVDEAADLLTRIPHVRSIAYLVADARSAAIVEASSTRVRVRQPEQGVIVSTNHWTVEGPPPGPRGEASSRRRRRAEAMLASVAPGATRGSVIDVLSDHEGGICVGDHEGVRGLDVQQGRSGTIWSLIARPADCEVEVAPGHPCVTPYERLAWDSDGCC